MTLYIDTKPTLDNWVEHDTDTFNAHYRCDTAFGRYIIFPVGKRFELYFKALVINEFDPFDTLSEAKAAAQADYDRRTAERFRPIVLPNPRDVLGAYDDAGHLRQYGAAAYKKNIEVLVKSAINRAKEGK